MCFIFLTNMTLTYLPVILCTLTLIIAVNSDWDPEVCDVNFRLRNHVHGLRQLKNCRVVNGSIELALVMKWLPAEKGRYFLEYVSLPKLEIITGHLIFYNWDGLTSIGKLFPNLRAIKGVTLFDDMYALVAYQMADLEQIGTSKLSYIGRGYVKMGKVPNLCFANTVNWTRIGAESFALYQEYRNDCPPCPSHCNGFCWNADTCQVFTDHCHEECLGCTKNNSNAHCEVCKNYDNDGVCVPECPPHKYVLRLLGKCVTEDECLARNENNSQGRIWFLHENQCIGDDDCPEKYQFDNHTKSCQYCGNGCVQYCGSAKLVNRISIEDMRRCTHINGSLSIMNLKNGDEGELLYLSLKNVRYIRDYLLIARNVVIENLGFLQGLTKIGGVNLYLTKYALMIFENRKLKKLFALSNNVKISNGTIAFHDNDQLCLSAIEKFANASDIKYNENDVSKYSNGDECPESVDEHLLNVNITVSTTNATISWNRLNEDSIFYYAVHYTHFYAHNTTIATQDVCGAESWTTYSTRTHSVELQQLNPYQSYKYYIQVYFTNMTTKKTPVNRFMTSPGDPEYSKNIFSATPINHTSIRLDWKKPKVTNGELKYYVISYYIQPDDTEFLSKRNYCTHPFSQEGKNVGQFADVNTDYTEEEILDMYKLGPREKISPDPPCEYTAQETNVRLTDDVWLYLCDKKSQSKYGFDYCKNYYYDVFGSNVSEKGVQKREATPSLKSSNKDNYGTLKIDKPDVPGVYVNDLKPFTMYVFYFMVCNEEFEGKKLCGPVIQVAARTKKNATADQITNLSVQKIKEVDLIVMWTLPDKINSVLLSYYVFHGKNRDHSKNQRECITHSQYIKSKNFLLRNVPPGSYYITVQAVSLAGPGNFSTTVLADITVTNSEFIWIILGLTFFLIFGILAAIAYYRIQVKRRDSDNQLIREVNPGYQLVKYEVDQWEMERDDIELQNLIGQGTFGRVFSGRIISRDLACAVKTVNEEASKDEIERFLGEASMMKCFTEGAHVIKLYGVVSTSHPPLVVMEIMQRGDLKNYLLMLKEAGQNLTSNEIYRMAIEIADGLAYLTSKKFTHRDLAARNCMVSNDRTVKIGDFGMTRDIYQSDYYKRGVGSALLPVRWMAPESIADGVYTYDSDMWSYGIVLWEIVTLAAQPYQGLSNEQVAQRVISKGTLDRPTDCPNLLWEIMHKCWNWYPVKRPTCFEVVETLQDHVGQEFKSLSFYHSTKGQDYLMSQGWMRPDNPPALYIRNRPSEFDPLKSSEQPETSRQAVEPEFIPPSSPQQSSSSPSMGEIEVHEYKPLVSPDPDSEAECESQL